MLSHGLGFCSLHANEYFEVSRHKPNHGSQHPLVAQDLTFAEYRLAYEAANAGYSLPNLRLMASLNNLGKREKFLATFRKFSNLTPPGYTIYGTDADIETGLKFVIYRPTSGEEQPWILSLTGTEETIDWINNLELGRPQLKGLKKIVTLFTGLRVIASF